MRRTVRFLILWLCVVGAVAHAETATIGSSADTYVSDSDIMGAKDYMSIYGGSRDDAGYVRFDLAAVNVGTVLEAQLVFRNSPTVDSAGHDERNDGINAGRFAVYGLNNVAGNTAQDWDETTLTEAIAGAELTGGFPKTDFADGRLTNLDGVEGVAITESIVDDPALDYWIAGNYTITLSGQALIDFLQARADDNGLATFIITCPDGGNRGFGIGTKENATEAYRPLLTLTYTPGYGVAALYPENKQSNVPLDVTLQWNGAADAADENLLDAGVLKHYVYIDYDNTDADPNLYYEDQVVVTDWSSRAASYGPLSLNYDDHVSWQIEEGMDNGSGIAFPPGDPNNILGSVWSFTALKSIPVVSADQPVSIRVFPNDPAVFTVEFASVSTPTVKWYKDDNTTAGEIAAGVTTTYNGNGSYTTTLTLGTPVSASDEGQYYCEVTNDDIAWFKSGVADLVVKRQLAQYAFDGSLTDSSDNGAPTGTALDTQGEPNSLLAVPAAISYVVGADGAAEGALYLAENQYVDFGIEGYPKAGASTSNGLGGGMDEGTIVFWVKPNVANVQQTLVGAFNNGTTDAFLALLQADQDLDIFIRGADGTTLANHPAGRPNRQEYNLADGSWHQVAACWSGSTSSLYVDGQWVVNGTGSAPVSFDAWQYGVLLGATRTSADRNVLSDMFRGGAIDNLRIYNYRLDADSVEAFAQEYLDNTGVHPCTNMTFAGSIYNFDNTGSSYCKVDLADFADFASAWLSDGLY